MHTLRSVGLWELGFRDGVYIKNGLYSLTESYEILVLTVLFSWKSPR